MVANFSKKQKGRFSDEKPLPKILGSLFLVAAMALILLDFNIIGKKEKLEAKNDSYGKQVAEMKQRNEKLKEEIANSGDPDYIEKVSREEFNMQKPGENVVVFVKQETDEEKLGEQKKRNPWAGWLSQSWQWIKSRF